MATDICTRRLTKELKSLMKDPIRSPTITVAPNEKNILEVHYVIEGSEKTPFAGGIYHGKLLFPKDYPLKPPSVIMITKNGRFQPNRRLCLSMSAGFVRVVVRFLLWWLACLCGGCRVCVEVVVCECFVHDGVRVFVVLEWRSHFVCGGGWCP